MCRYFLVLNVFFVTLFFHVTARHIPFSTKIVFSWPHNLLVQPLSYQNTYFDSYVLKRINICQLYMILWNPIAIGLCPNKELNLRFNLQDVSVKAFFNEKQWHIIGVYEKVKQWVARFRKRSCKASFSTFVFSNTPQKSCIKKKIICVAKMYALCFHEFAMIRGCTYLFSSYWSPKTLRNRINQQKKYFKSKNAFFYLFIDSTSSPLWIQVAWKQICASPTIAK